MAGVSSVAACHEGFCSVFQHGAEQSAAKASASPESSVASELKLHTFSEEQFSSWCAVWFWLPRPRCGLCFLAQMSGLFSCKFEPGQIPDKLNL
mmetsp:Transcript_13545/g.30054  ORF Transcript_13545/g.30054 Transcript_13545/m.30054 type:complete len:94 (+) Transcript_13545:1477-1758(+)